MHSLKRYQKKKLMLQWFTAALSILLGLSFEINASAGFNSEDLSASLIGNGTSFQLEKKNPFTHQYLSVVNFAHENHENEPFEKEVESEDIAGNNWQDLKFNFLNTTVGAFKPINRNEFQKVPLYIQYLSLKIHLS